MKYDFKALNSSGFEIKDEIEANGIEDAVKLIRMKGFFPTIVKEKNEKQVKESLFSKFISKIF